VLVIYLHRSAAQHLNTVQTSNLSAASFKKCQSIAGFVCLAWSKPTSIMYVIGYMVDAIRKCVTVDNDITVWCPSIRLPTIV
jgi:hypothetical protein